MQAQRFTNEKDPCGFYRGRFITFRLVSDETPSEILHLWSGSAHLEICSHSRRDGTWGAPKIKPAPIVERDENSSADRCTSFSIDTPTVLERARTEWVP